MVKKKVLNKYLSNIYLLWLYLATFLFPFWEPMILKTCTNDSGNKFPT